MQRFFSLITLAVTLITTLLLTTQPVNATMNASTPADCSPAAIQGAYAFFTASTVVVDQCTVIALPETLLTNSPVMLASAGTVQLDDQGQAILTATQAVNGEAMTATAYAGSYNMTDGCNATITLDNGVWFTVRLVNTNDPPQLLSTTPGFVLLDKQ